MFDMSNVEVLSEAALMDKQEVLNSYYKDLIGATNLYIQGITGKDLVCAVIDSGCDCDHVLLKDKIIGGKNFTNEGKKDDYSDLNGHGTHVAGLIAGGEYGPFRGGIAPDAKLIIAKALNAEGSGSMEGIIEAINWCVDQDVNVINMSLGGPVDIPELHKAVKRACKKGIIVCVASGNEAESDYGKIDELCYPGAYQEVVEIGAINKFKVPSFFSNSNNVVDCVTYGQEILSTFPDQSFAVLDGTSMATPIASGCVLLIQQWFEKEFGRKPTKDEVYATLIKCTTEIEGFNRKQQGHGYIDLDKLEN